MGMFATVDAGVSEPVKDGLTDAVYILGQSWEVIKDNPILLAIFACALLVAGFKVFKRAKNSVKG